MMQPGTLLLGRFRIERIINSGSTAVVYAATDLHQGGRRVALKVRKKDLGATLGLSCRSSGGAPPATNP
jgi:hypothetical protein